MATDPVWPPDRYGTLDIGLLIGFLTVLIRVPNPAYREGIMFAILFGNVFAPLIDYFVIQVHMSEPEHENR